MSTFKIIAVTNRKQCKNTLEKQVEKLGGLCDLKNIKSNDRTFMLKPDMLILREKDMSEDEYEILAKKIIEKCSSFHIECILHNFVEVAKKMKYGKIHLPFSVFQSNLRVVYDFNLVGVSCHSVDEAIFAQKNRASYITTGHIFETDCKKDLQPRGIMFLNKVCTSVKIPVYAIGGIEIANMDILKSTAADGACMMSEYMKIYLD